MSITRVKKRITKTTLNSVSYATHKQLSDHSVKIKMQLNFEIVGIKRDVV